jgi:hypothetical protein
VIVRRLGEAETTGPLHERGHDPVTASNFCGSGGKANPWHVLREGD